MSPSSSGRLRSVARAIRVWFIIMAFVAAPLACTTGEIVDGDDRSRAAAGGHAVAAAGGSSGAIGSGGTTSPPFGTAGGADQTAAGRGGARQDAAAGGGEADAPPRAGAGASAAADGGARDGTTVSSNDPSLVPALMAVGTGGIRVLSVDNGATWKRVAEDSPNGGDDVRLLRTVAYGNGIWVAGGVFRILTSRDGRTWTEHDRNGRGHESITFGLGKFVSIWGGEVATSDDGQRWTFTKRLDIGAHCYVMFVDGKYVAWGWEDRRAYSSTDAVNWEPIAPGRYAYCDGALRTEASCFNALWSDGAYLRPGGGISRSLNGRDWMSVYRDDHGNSVFSNAPAVGMGVGFVPRN